VRLVFKLIPGLLGSLILFMMQVKPLDAAANLCDWANSSLTERLYSFCLADVTPQSLQLTALGLITLSAALIFLHPLFQLLKRLSRRSPWKSIPPTDSNLDAYIRPSAVVAELDNQIAKNEQRKLSSDQTMALPAQEKAKFFGIRDVYLLNMLLEENHEAVIRLSSYGFYGQSVPRGACIIALFDVLGAQLGDEDFQKLNLLCRLLRIDDDGIRLRLKAYKEFRKNHTARVRVPLVDDFNLIPIEDALQLARARCRRTALESLSAIGRVEDELLGYFNRLKDRTTFYGTIRGRTERMPIGFWRQFELFPPPMYPLSSAVSNARFEGGKIIVNSQLFQATSDGSPPKPINVTYENLYVLRPDLSVQLKAIK
jgi:hypothetical protein